MDKELRILILEDMAADAELIRYELRRANIIFSSKCVETKETFLNALGDFAPDLILADYTLPSFDGLLALAFAQERCPEVPFIFVSGSLGEELAIETLKGGATDYVLKHRLSRLVPAVRRALGEAEARAERKLAEEQLASSLEQLRALAAHLQSVREEERTRIAREIHDELGQILTGLKIDLSWLDAELAAGDLTTPRLPREKVKSMSNLIDTTIQVVRKIATELRPGILDDLGLAAALEWQAQEFQTRTGIRCEFTSTLEEIDLDAGRSTAVFRIFQETLTNVARHAHATGVRISVKEQGSQLLLEVRDDGRGITDHELANPRSLGLLGMRERALLFGGEVKIGGVLGNGTTVTVSVPLSKSRAIGEAR